MGRHDASHQPSMNVLGLMFQLNDTLSKVFGLEVAITKAWKAEEYLNSPPHEIPSV